MYAVVGELAQNKVVDDNDNIKEDALATYLRRLLRPGVATKHKEWIEVWAAMSIPIDKQHIVLLHLLDNGLQSEVAEDVAEIVGELIKGHRVKIKAVEEAVCTLFECGCDHEGFLARMFFVIFPKSPTSEWGWSRVGWSWTQWWQLAERILNALAPGDAFDLLAGLLRTIETESGAYFSHQQIWDEKRLSLVREALCRYGGFEDAEVSAAVGITLE